MTDECKLPPVDTVLIRTRDTNYIVSKHVHEVDAIVLDVQNRHNRALLGFVGFSGTHGRYVAVPEPRTAWTRDALLEMSLVLVKCDNKNWVPTWEEEA